MKAGIISIVLENAPKGLGTVPSNYMDEFESEMPDISGPVDECAVQYSLEYKDLALGWKLAGKYARARKPLPSVMEGKDHWMYQAWQYHLNPKRADKAVAKARALTTRAMKYQKDVIDASLVTKDITTKDIARIMRMDPEVIECYENLFFNILDRKADSLFIASIVYPNGRFVEMDNNYTSNEAFGKLLMRAGYNNGLEHVLYLSGVSDSLLKSFTVSAMGKQLENLIMANGYVLATNGFLNQRDSTGLYRAQELLAAAKQSGTDVEAGTPFQEASTSLRDELVAISKNTATLRHGLKSGSLDLPNYFKKLEEPVTNIETGTN